MSITNNVALNYTTAFLLAWSTAAIASSAQNTPVQDTSSQRVDSAKTLIDEDKAFISGAKDLHQQAQKEIETAKELKGQAEYLRSVMPTPPALKLSPEQYQIAAVQYQSDINSFKQHAEAYAEHIKEFQSQLGVCHINEDSYKHLVDEYQLHCNQFHLPNIAPPHICLQLNLSQTEATNIASLIRIDAMRVLNAEQDLDKEENRLQFNTAQAPYLADKAVNQAQRQEREQILAQEFGRLKQEHDLLDMERQQLQNKNTKPIVANKSVSGRIANKHK